MTVLPIVERELRVASRKRGTYWLRVTAALVAIAVFAWMILTLSRDNVPPASQGRFLFRALFTFAFFSCLFIGARVTADNLSEEKREGTLGLLFLTDLKGYDVILGKLVAASLSSFYGLLAIIPVMVVTAHLGGVTAHELFRASLVLLNTLLFSLAAGIFVSTLSRNERKAMFATIFLILLVAFGPFLARRMFMVSPAYGFGDIIFWGPRMPFFGKASFWWSLSIVLLFSWALLAVASWILPRIWQTRAADSKLDKHRARIEQWTYGAAGERRTHRTRLLDINPFLWLAGRERWKPYYVWLYLGAVTVTWLWGWSHYKDVMFDRKTLMPGVLLFQAFLKIWIISEACNRLAEDRRSGALELLLSTPLTTRDILRGQWLALRRQFVRPMLVILVMEYFVLRKEFSSEMVFLNLAMVVADAITLGWVGMWMGLTARNTSRAILGAIGRVLILPWGIFYAGGVTFDLLWRVLMLRPFEPDERARLYIWFAIGIVVNALFGLVWARRNLLRNFRAVTVQRVEPEGRRWIARLFSWKQSEPDGSLAPVS